MKTATAEASASGRPSEADRVLQWRRDELERAGYCRSAASAIASRRDIDLHVAVTLPRSGCAHNLALRILL